MICKFQVGQKVLCIDDSVQLLGVPDPNSYGIFSGNVYTIARIAIGEITQTPMLFLEGIHHPGDGDYIYGLSHLRFRALDDQLLEPFREYCRTREDALGGLILVDNPGYLTSEAKLQRIWWSERNDPECW